MKADKKFSLSKYHPVGIMVYGNAIFMGVPWETIIKIYRKQLNEKRFDKLHDYYKDFINFLQNNNNNFFPETEQDKYVKESIFAYFIMLRNEIRKIVNDKTIDNIHLNNKDIKNIVSNIISKHLSLWKECKSFLSNYKKIFDDLLKINNKFIIEKIKEVFEEIPLSNESKNALKEITGYLFVAFPDNLTSSGISGIVISGFGDKEIFPSIVSCTIEGMANNILKYKEDDYSQIDFNTSAMIVPFAQREMVDTFINGISPSLEEKYNNLLFKTIDEYAKIIIDNLSDNDNTKNYNEIIKKIKTISIENIKIGFNELNNDKINKFTKPIMNVVQYLSKKELAEMAESLVNLTCLRKKISMDDETVGGPIDVAVISKGDGLIWIKRKHYFEQELNKPFFINYLEK